jgi:arabinogalactan oligomer/maltooligosaccharide transport system substrate-binding protein
MKALGESIYHGEVTEANLQSQLDALVDSITSTLTN